ncbi:PepSY domain-containing protein [uncultured Anaerococcus sp.]|uniref:PepSY domain-containing protein n=1 Tax=uncultured Anaerococcus sp. TaxID=293428 RepID=UPI00288B8E94|nr:PepSY domain-containing protein [uncultured Anaerococcus sp.]
MKNKNLALVLATAIVLVACGNQGSKPKEETKQEVIQVDKTKTGVKEVKDDEKKPNEEEKERVPVVATNLDEALKIFHDHNFGDGSFDAINIDKLKVKILDKDIIYSIEGFKDGKEYKLKINNKGEILEEEVEEDDDNKKLAIDFTKIISGVDAMDKAIEGQDKKAWVKEYEIKIEDGKVVYDLDIENGQDVKIDATTGDIIERD